MKRKSIIVYAALVLGIISLISAGWWWWTGSSLSAKEPAAQAKGIQRDGSKTEPAVQLSTGQLAQFGVETATAGPGRFQVEMALSGDVAIDADRVAHVGSRVSGVVREVRKNLGDPVHHGEVMAVLESRELADAAAALMAARERVSLAQNTFNREEQLWKKKISPEQDFIQAKNALAEAGIEQRTAEQKLRALGLGDEYLATLAAHPERETIRYEIVAPFDATVIEKHISLGEVIKDETPAFLIADLSSVWVNLDVYQKDLPYIRIGQTALISAGHGIPDAPGRISFLEPTALETTRTIHARVVLPNTGGRWRPGLFVTGRIVAEDVPAAVLVPSDALLLIDGKTCLFVKEGEAFRPREVTIGRTNGRQAEITAGLAPGQVYAAKGAFTLKSELEKPQAEE